MTWHAANVNADDHADWQPGDQNPYANRGSYSNYLFNFRDSEADDHLEPSGDAASWPNPRPGRGIPEGDELGDFIAEWHAWQASQAQEAS